MFKIIQTIIRGRATDAAEGFFDANAGPVLRQQLRDASSELEKSKRAVAVVMAYAERERTSVSKLNAQLADLEARALEALEKGRDSLAADAAAAIANLEAERGSCQTSVQHYDREIAQLREKIKLSEQQLRVLQRGKHVADAVERTQHLRGTAQGGLTSNLKDAEATLERLQSQQLHSENVDAALAELNINSSTQTVTERLAVAKCGAPLRSDAEDVLDRLRKKVA